MTPSTFDLGAYLARIGWDRPVAPDLATLTGLVSRQALTIPFENLDIVLGRGIGLDVASLQRKLVQAERGGYCFELNGLLRAALEAIGFTVRPMLGRVVLGMSADAQSPRTHIVSRVVLPEGDMLADVGFGRLAPTGPLRFDTESVQTTPHESCRLVPMGPETLLQVEVDGEWNNCYRLSPEPVFPVDVDMANWFTSTRPGGLFTTHLIVARPGPGTRATLFNGRLTVRGPNGTNERRQLTGPADYRAALERHFGLTLPEDDLAAVAAAGDERAAAGLLHPGFAAADA